MKQVENIEKNDCKKYGRKKEKKVVASIYKLWKECFADTEEYMKFYFDVMMKKNCIYTIEKEQEVIAMLQLNPYQLRFYGKDILSDYVVGVATKTSYRKKGLMRKLLHTVMQELYQQKKMFIYLMPAAYELYAPHDFRYIYTQNRIEMKKKEGGAVERYQVKSWESLSDSQKESVVLFLEKKLSGEFKIYTHRNMDYEERILHEMKACQGDLVVISDCERIQGVIAYMYEEDKIHIAESILDTKKTKEICMSFLDYVKCEKNLNHVDVILYESYFYDMEQLKEVAELQKEYRKPIIMARIIHMKELLQKLRSREKIECVIGVKDSVIRENNGNYLVQMDRESSKVEKTKQPADICLDIATWTSFFLEGGELETYILSSQEVVVLSKVSEQLKKIERGGRNYLNEIV